jgi:hypothetical protein
MKRWGWEGRFKQEGDIIRFFYCKESYAETRGKPVAHVGWKKAPDRSWVSINSTLRAHLRSDFGMRSRKENRRKGLFFSEKILSCQSLLFVNYLNVLSPTGVFVLAHIVKKDQ